MKQKDSKVFMYVRAASSFTPIKPIKLKMTSCEQTQQDIFTPIGQPILSTSMNSFLLNSLRSTQRIFSANELLKMIISSNTARDRLITVESATPVNPHCGRPKAPK